MTTFKAIHTEAAPAAVGPYSQATTAGDLIFCSGQIALDPKTSSLVEGGLEAQTHQVMANLKAVLAAAGGSFATLVKTTIYLSDMNDFRKVNEVYSSYLGAPYPARVTIEASSLPLGALVEIDAIAYRSP